MGDCTISTRGICLTFLCGGGSAGAIYFIYFIFTSFPGASGIMFTFIPLTIVMVTMFFYLLFCGWWSCDGTDPMDRRPCDDSDHLERQPLV